MGQDPHSRTPTRGQVFLDQFHLKVAQWKRHGIGDSDQVIHNVSSCVSMAAVLMDAENPELIRANKTFDHFPSYEWPPGISDVCILMCEYRNVGPECFRFQLQSFMRSLSAWIQIGNGDACVESGFEFNASAIFNTMNIISLGLGGWLQKKLTYISHGPKYFTHFQKLSEFPGFLLDPITEMLYPCGGNYPIPSIVEVFEQSFFKIKKLIETAKELIDEQIFPKVTLNPTIDQEDKLRDRDLCYLFHGLIEMVSTTTFLYFDNVIQLLMMLKIYQHSFAESFKISFDEYWDLYSRSPEYMKYFGAFLIGFLRYSKTEYGVDNNKAYMDGVMTGTQIKLLVGITK